MGNAPSDRDARFGKRVGVWTGAEVEPPSQWAPDGIKAEGRSEVRTAAGGTALVTDYTQTVDGEVRMHGLAVTTWDSAADCYVMYWFDSNGSAPMTFQGGYDGDVLVLEGEIPQGARMRHRTDYPDDDTTHTVSEICFDGENWIPAFEGTYGREGSS